MSFSQPYRWRTRIRRNLSWFLIDLGVAGKGEDCESAGGQHEWYNHDDANSACYHCKVIKPGRLWESAQLSKGDGGINK
jgi:hypothetical protein